MGKVFLNHYDFSTVGLMGEGRLFKFYLNGKSQGESQLDFKFRAQEEVDVLSILTTNGRHIELGLHIDGQFQTQAFGGTLTDLIRKANAVPNLRFAGVQSGVLDGDTCTQYLFVYALNNLTKEKLLA